MTIQSMALIGTGVMGMGIAQIAAQAGLEVRLFDAKAGAAEAGLAKLKATLEKLQAKDKFTEAELHETMARCKSLNSIEAVAGVDLVVVDIIENLDLKQSLFKQRAGIVSSRTILATITSSLSVTAIASNLEPQGR